MRVRALAGNALGNGVLRLFVALGLALLALTACGTPAPTSTTSAEPLSLLPSADPFHSAVVATRALGTARIVIDGSIRTSTGIAPVSAQGVTVLGSGMGDLNWITPQGSFRELVNSRGIYVTANGTDWTQWPVSDPTATSRYVDPLRGLGVLRDVSKEGTEVLDGVSTTRYTGWLPGDGREDVTVWIDDSGHVIRVDRSAKDAKVNTPVTMTTTMEEFSLQLDLTSPSGNVTLGATTLP